MNTGVAIFSGSDKEFTVVSECRMTTPCLLYSVSWNVGDECGGESAICYFSEGILG